MDDELMTALDAGAVQFHENFMAHVRAGFTRAEALEIVLTILTTSMRLNAELRAQGDDE